MANIQTRSITVDEYNKLIGLISSGYTDNKGIVRKANKRVACALVTEANLGMRIGDVLRLRLSDFAKEGNFYRINVTESKTSKKRHYSMNLDMYTYLLQYAHDMGIGKDAKLFDISVRNVQKILKNAVDCLGLIDVSTHGFRKMYCGMVYEASGQDLRVTQAAMLHAHISTTMRYLAVDERKLNKVLAEHVMLPSST